MKRLVLASALALVGGHGAVAHSYKLGPLEIGHPWAMPAPPGAPTAAGYLTVTNTGKTGDRLLGGSSPLAKTLEIHSMTMTGGVMRMRPVSGGLEIEPGQTVKVEPGGYHVMFVAPTRPFKVGDHVPATLRFQHAGSIAVDFHVQAGPTMEMPMLPGTRP
jgi:copper(I)-binding protein